MDPDKILQAYVGWAEIWRINILASWAKGPQNGGEKMSVFVTGTTELAFLCNGTDRHEIRENVNRYALLDLNRRILKIFPQGVCSKTAILASFDGSPCHRSAGQGLHFSTR